MNPLQMAQQIKHLLQAAQWEASPQHLVFGAKTAVVVCVGDPTPEAVPAGMPWCIVSIGNGKHDENDPALMEQEFRLFVATEVAGDPMGELAVIGGAAASLGKSANRGIGEVVERVRNAVQALTGMDGARIALNATGAGAVRAHSAYKGRQIVVQDMDLSALCLSAPYYSAPQRLRHNGTAWLWEGDHCEARFDFMRYVLVSKAGTSPSDDPSDGTVLFTGTAQTFAAAATAGLTYTVFAQYDGRGRGSPEGASQPEVGSWRTVA